MKRIFSLLLASAMLLSLAACGGDEVPAADAAEETEEGVTLDVVTSYGGDDGNRKNFETAVAAYEKATGNRVNDGSANSNEEWKAKVLTDFETGSEPDVLFYFTNADAEPFIAAEKVVSIHEIREMYPEYASNMKEDMLAVSADGRNYTVPSSGFWENMYVNMKVLDACGIEVPGPDYTWDKFLGDCQTIKDAGYIPIACSLFEVPHYWFEFAVMNNGTLENQLEVPTVDENGKLVDDEVSAKWIAAIEDLKYLYEQGFFPENTLTATDADTAALFGDGQAAFLIDGSWKVGYLTKNHGDRLDDFAVSYVPAKGERKASEAIGGISMGYFITRKAWDDPEKREAAVRFVEYLTSDEVLSTFSTTEVTALINGAKPVGLNTLQQSAAKVNSNLTGVSGAVQDTITAEAKSELFGNIKKVVSGQMTARDAVERAINLNS